jgi:hypothetical protein
MDRIGLAFEEFAELKIKPRTGAGAAFHEAAAMQLKEMFPMTLIAASSHLRSRGYDCRPEMLEVLIRKQVVRPTNPDAWSPADVDAAAVHFEECEMFTPYAAMCQTLGCRYADFLKPPSTAGRASLAPLLRRPTSMKDHGPTQLRRSSCSC